jgi:hypothetical protein
LVGPALFNVVRCPNCRALYNGRTGSEVTPAMIARQLIALVLIAAAACAYLTLRP